jgi:cytochrome c55X
MAISGSRGFAPALFAGLLFSSVSACLADGEPGAPASSPASVRQSELVQLVRHDCGSCHGLTLAGGLGPALLPEAMAGKPTAYIEHVILYGRSGTAMPAWNGLVSEDDARWIAQELRKGFPRER